MSHKKSEKFPKDLPQLKGLGYIGNLQLEFWNTVLHSLTRTDFRLPWPDSDNFV